MRASRSSVALIGVLFSQTAFASWRQQPPFPCPNNIANDCTQSEQQGFDWQDLPDGNFKEYNSFQFDGWKCGTRPGKGGNLGQRAFGDKCIQSNIDRDTFTNSIRCPSKAFSIGDMQVSVGGASSTDIEIHYLMEDGQICRKFASCSESGDIISNDQCGGAKEVKVKIPQNSDQQNCQLFIHKINFVCGNTVTTVPVPTTPIPLETATTGVPPAQDTTTPTTCTPGDSSDQCSSHNSSGAPPPVHTAPPVDCNPGSHNYNSAACATLPTTGIPSTTQPADTTNSSPNSGTASIPGTTTEAPPAPGTTSPTAGSTTPPSSTSPSSGTTAAADCNPASPNYNPAACAAPATSQIPHAPSETTPPPSTAVTTAPPTPKATTPADNTYIPTAPESTPAAGSTETPTTVSPASSTGVSAPPSVPASTPLPSTTTPSAECNPSHPAYNPQACAAITSSQAPPASDTTPPATPAAPPAPGTTPPGNTGETSTQTPSAPTRGCNPGDSSNNCSPSTPPPAASSETPKAAPPSSPPPAGTAPLAECNPANPNYNPAACASPTSGQAPPTQLSNSPASTTQVPASPPPAGSTGTPSQPSQAGPSAECNPASPNYNSAACPTASAAPPPPTFVSPEGKTTAGTPSTPQADTTSAAGPPPPTDCPNLVPRCLKTWIFTTGCTDTADTKCFCQNKKFFEEVVDCINSWGTSNDEVQKGIEYFFGLCAAFVEKNPEVITCIPSTITLGASSTPVPAPSGTASVPAPSLPAQTSPAPAQQPPPSVQATQTYITATVTKTAGCSPKTISGSIITQTSSVYPTTITIPLVALIATSTEAKLVYPPPVMNYVTSPAVQTAFVTQVQTLSPVIVTTSDVQDHKYAILTEPAAVVTTIVPTVVPASVPNTLVTQTVKTQPSAASSYDMAKNGTSIPLQSEGGAERIFGSMTSVLRMAAVGIVGVLMVVV